MAVSDTPKLTITCDTQKKRREREEENVMRGEIDVTLSQERHTHKHTYLIMTIISYLSPKKLFIEVEMRFFFEMRGAKRRSTSEWRLTGNRELRLERCLYSQRLISMVSNCFFHIFTKDRKQTDRPLLYLLLMVPAESFVNRNSDWSSSRIQISNLYIWLIIFEFFFSLMEPKSTTIAENYLRKKAAVKSCTK